MLNTTRESGTSQSTINAKDQILCTEEIGIDLYSDW